MCKSKQTVFIQLGDDSEKLNRAWYADCIRALFIVVLK